MDLNDKLQTLQHDTLLPPREEKILETLQASKDLYDRLAQDRLMDYREFLWSQFTYTRKRWWCLQAALLLLAFQALSTMTNSFFRVRSVGVIGCLFVVFMIPELWRNKEWDSTQVEASCLYSLRQIYAARITLFGIVDVALLTLFSISLTRLGLHPMDILVQFLLPVAVTACICFSMLCGKRNCSEAASLTASLTWCALWWLILMNENLYVRIVPSVWVGLFGLALAFLVLAVRRTIRTTNQYWEMDIYGITIG